MCLKIEGEYMEKQASNLKQIYLKKQEMLLAKSGIRLPHPVKDGDIREFNWVAFIRGFLPTRYSVSSAILIDSKGCYSDQIDIVIYDTHFTPPIFHSEAAMIIPIESAYAIFEVKPKLDRKGIEYAAEKIKSAISLHRTTAEIYHADGIYNPKKPLAIIGGILADKSDAKSQTLVRAIEDNPAVDIACSLNSGMYFIKHNENFYMSQDQVDASKIKKEYNVVKSSDDEGLISLFIILLNELQKRASVSAIDLVAYGKELSIFEGNKK